MERNKKLHVFGTCTNNKSLPILKECHLRSLGSLRFDLASKQWCKNLVLENQHKVRAAELYIGSHWKETLACVDEANLKGFDTDLWILSAGWGLLPSDMLISPYAATFASSGEDSIHRLGWPAEYSKRERCRLWWEYTNAEFADKKPYSILSLGVDQDALSLFVLSKDYFFAIEQELLEIISKGCDVLIVSAGLYTEKGLAHPQIKDRILPFNDKFKQLDPYLNKTNVSLNARLANWLIREHSDTIKLGVEKTVSLIEKIEKSLPEMERKAVAKITDEEVLAFIGKHYVPQVSNATLLLKILRQKENKSCEQKRFGELFRIYQSQNDRGLF